MEDDHDPGVFKVAVTLQKAGAYSLQILIGGLTVPTLLQSQITVSPAESTSPSTSSFSGALSHYLTGESVKIDILARDEFSNPRASSADTFKLTLTGLQSSTVYGPFDSVYVENNLHRVSFKFEVVEDYSLAVTLNDEHIIGSPVSEIVVKASDVQAELSELFYEASVTAGEPLEWSIRARDLFNNIVVDTDERFSLDIQSTQTG